jgi:hypothetical protein
MRTFLPASQIYNVSKAGSDSNDGTPAAPWLTIQRALSFIATQLDGGGNDVTISIGDGTYPESLRIYSPLVGVRTLILVGNTTTLGAVSLVGNGSDTFQMNQPSAFVILAGMRISAGLGGNSDCVHVSGGTVQIGRGVSFGSAQQNHLDADGNGNIVMTADYTIEGSTGAAHFSSSFGGMVSAVGVGVSIPSPVLFNGAFAQASDGANIQAIGLRFQGTANGPKFVTARNANIFTAGAGEAAFPGNSPGIRATGGQYN